MIVLAALAVFMNYHRITVIQNPIGVGGCQIRSKDPPSKDTRKFLDRVLIIGGNRITTPVHYPSPVLIQCESPDGKQLEDLTRVVFIGLRFHAHPTDISIRRRGSLAAVVHHIEETTHSRVERYVVKQLTEIAKCL